MAETEGSDDTSDELLNKSLSVWSAKSALGKEKFEPIPLDLHTACSLGQYDCVKNYITRGEVDLDKRNKGGWTAVMYACYIGHDNIVNLLCDADIGVNIRNHKGETPLMLAASCGNERVGFLLCSHGSELELKDERGWTALFHATYSGHQNMVRFLLEQGANINAVEQSVGMTPFMEAAAEGHEIILQLFLQHGVNVNAKAYNGDTARSLALINGNMKIVSLIDNHVMPITSLRSEPGLSTDLSSSDDAFNRVRPPTRGRVRVGGGGPSIMDGPQAIARLIDRTRDNVPPPKQEEGLVPKGYVTFPDEDGTSQANKKLSYRDVTSPINPDDHKLDNSGGRESFEIEDDTNAFSKTGALTIKSSSGSSGGLAAALGIRREDSLDSDEFPNESSCEDSHPHGNSGDSSSEDGVEGTGLTNQIAETLKNKPGFPENVDNVDKPGFSETCDKPSFSGTGIKPVTEKPCNNKQPVHKMKKRKSKDKLTAENVNEIEVMKNSVSEWIDSVQDTQPIPEHPIDTPDITDNKDNTTVNTDTPAEMFDKISALKPEYQSVKKGHTKDREQGKCLSKSFDIEESFSSDRPVTADLPNPHSIISENKSLHNPSHLPQSHVVNSDFLDQVAKKVQCLELESGSQTAARDPSSVAVAQDPAVQYVSEPQLPGTSATQPPVSALNILNTNTQTPSQDHHAPAQTTPAVTYHQNTPGYHANHPPMPISVPPGFPPGFTAYQMFPQGVPQPPPTFTAQTPTTSMYPNPVSTTATHPDIQPVIDAPTSSTNSRFIEKMGDTQPHDLAALLEQLGLLKYLPTFDEQDVDLQVFLSLTDNDLKEVGIKLFGPRKKMTNAIARWQGQAKVAVGELEHAYADRLAGELQEIGGQLHLACEQVEKLKAQVKQEQQLRNVTETCLMEERAAWQHVQRIIMDTRQQCEDFKDVFLKLMQYTNELKARVSFDASSGQQKRPIRGQSAIREDHASKTKAMMSSDQMPTDSVVRKVDYYMQEIKHLLLEVTGNTDRLLGRNAEPDNMERGYT